jgi:hypothetical protein
MMRTLRAHLLGQLACIVIEAMDATPPPTPDDDEYIFNISKSTITKGVADDDKAVFGINLQPLPNLGQSVFGNRPPASSISSAQLNRLDKGSYLPKLIARMNKCTR